MHDNLLAISVALVVALWSQAGDWGRRPWSDQYQPSISQRLNLPATYFLLDKPIAYVAPLLAHSSRFYQIADIALPVVPNGKFDRRIRTGLKTPQPGGIWEMHIRGKPVREGLLAPYSLAIDTSKTCVEIEGAQPRSTIEACPLTKKGS
jgi:hypothetical protein